MHENKVEELLSGMIKRYPHLNPAVAEDWLENVISLSVETVDYQDNYRSPEHREQMIERGVTWHINKLSGFNGNDMSALIMEYNGDYYPFGSASDVIKEKICVSAPEQLFGDGERKMVLLPTVKKKFLKEMAAYELRPYDLGYDKAEELEKSGGVPGLPWMKSRPESIYIDKNNEVWLVSFKVPAEHDTVISAYEDPGLYYKASLAQDKIFLERAGVKVHHTAIVPFSTKEMKVYVSEFPVDYELEKKVIDAGNEYWDFVLRNELPQRPMGKNFSHIKQVPAAFQKIIVEYVISKKVESISTDKAKGVKSRLLEMAKTIGIDWEELDKKTRLPGVDISHKEARSFNASKLKDDFRMLGGNPDDDKYFNNREQTTVSVIRGQKTDYSLMINELQEIASRAFDDAHTDGMEYLSIDNSMLPKPSDPTLVEPEIATSVIQEPVIQKGEISAGSIKTPDTEIGDFAF
ncbi:hypothetical protein D3C87_351960 [compost metagenome]